MSLDMRLDVRLDVRRLEDLPPVLKPTEVAGALRIHVEDVRELIRAGKLRATNIGKGATKPTYRIKRDDVISFMDGDTNQGRQAA